MTRKTTMTIEELEHVYEGYFNLAASLRQQLERTIGMLQESRASEERLFRALIQISSETEAQA